ncbi:GCN5-related N-acetyltransferase [Allomuricauda ruestringensis DSM 13258]|uniref:GCN5-related N-acetyltransferase n=1 Tax=Allomuricauda ruestringensis (strain DSM 13258 / CIP 107369 / LMG 19739 / B1) TaxID=886377 RepID=G2PIC4_ALLRU|nr:GNAT family N-acetyltransferase [Allomuricauda ruestringensis]AEM71742.1 GCN5-related N-acetyltransferase [Allomuricauda ruestringensis DSM 13258]
MNKQIIDHLFEFWEQIGKHGNFLTKENGFSFAKPTNGSWPNKVFDLTMEKLDIHALCEEIISEELPNSIAVPENEAIKDLLRSKGLRATSKIKAMTLDTTNIFFGNIDASEFIKVGSPTEAELFAQVATESFGYPVDPSTIGALVDKPGFQIFLGNHENAFPSCGMVYLDQNGVSGIHMIGTKAGYRGLGLGKKMTQFLVNQSIENQSKEVYLVASQAGERIYTKMGFTTHGVLESYSLSLH